MYEWMNQTENGVLHTTIVYKEENKTQASKEIENLY